MNMMMLLEMASGAMGDRVAIGDAVDGLTYEQVFDLAGRMATHLRQEGHERLLYCDISTPALPIALFGSAWAGKAFVPLSYRLADDRLRDLVGRQAPAYGLCGDDVQARLSATDNVAMSDPVAYLDSLGAYEPAESDWNMDEDDIAVLLHTSGTSGEPKVAILRQKHLVSYIIGSVEFMGAGDDEATLISVPPYHIAGMAAILSNVFAGRRIVQLANFEEHEWVRLVREQKVTHAMVVPTMLARIVDVLEDGQGLPSLRTLSYGGGRMPLPIIERALELLPHVNFVNAYGLTETSSSISLLGPDDHRDAIASNDPAVRARLGSVGKPLPTVEIEIRDPDDNPVPTGTSGEVWVRGDQVSGEYAKRGAVTTNGWFPTNDGGHFDEEGFLFVEGRLDDVIVRGGENLSPGEIEDVLLSHPSVKEAVVLGLPDVQWGEIVAAVIVQDETQPAVSDDDLRAWVSKQLRSSRAPARIERRAELPYNDTGKVLRRVLRTELG